MLDRKTKDIDASIELLEDKIQSQKKIGWLYLVTFAFTGITSLIFFAFNMKDTAEVLLICGMALGIITVIIFHDLNFYQLLIYLKQHETKRKK